MKDAQKREKRAKSASDSHRKNEVFGRKKMEREAGRTRREYSQETVSFYRSLRDAEGLKSIVECD